MTDVKVFGAAFDPLDLRERVDLKLAYLDWIDEQGIDEDHLSDPYDYVKAQFREKQRRTGQVEWIGKLPIESWLRPKPSISDVPKILPEKFTEFLDSNGCYEYYKRLVKYLKDKVGSSVPVMIGVDHCLTGGVLEFLSEKYDSFQVVVFDSHSDIVDLEVRRAYFGGVPEFEAQNFGKEVYECGSFLWFLLNEGIIEAEKLWILGTQDLTSLERQAEPLYSTKILPWIKQGVHIVSKEDLVVTGIPKEIRGPTYISFDMDLGSLSAVLATRFLNYVGLTFEQIMNLLDELSRRIRFREMELIGLDIMEVDVHFLGANVEGNQDCTAEIAHEIIDRFVYRSLS